MSMKGRSQTPSWTRSWANFHWSHFQFPRKKEEEYSTLAATADDDDQPLEAEDSVAGPGARRSRNVVRALIAALVILAVLNLALLSAALRLYKDSHKAQAQGHAPLLDTPVPGFSWETKTFAEDIRYVVRPSPESDGQWEGLYGPSDADHLGFIWVGDYARHGLNASEIKDGRGLFGVSMLHQLHCLGGIRRMFWDVIEGRISPADLLAEYPSDTSNPSFSAMTHGLWHIAHCFDYVRQALMCAGDMSLESPVRANGRVLVVGWDNPHECRNWDEMWRYLEDHSR